MQMSSTTEPMCGNSSQISVAALAELLELGLRPEADQLLPLELGELLPLGQALGHRLAVHLGQLRLVVERLQVRRPAGHRQPDDPLRLGRAGAAGRATPPRRGWRRRGSSAGSSSERQRDGAEALRGSRRGRPGGVTAATPIRSRSRSHRVQFRVMVSWRFRSTRATLVQAASSAGVEPAGGGATGRPSAAPRRPPGRRGSSARCLSSSVADGLGLVVARGSRWSACRQAQSSRAVGVGAAFLEDPRGEGAGRLDVGRVVQQHQRLLRDVRAARARPRTPRGWGRRRRAGSGAGTSAATRCRARGDTGSRPCRRRTARAGSSGSPSSHRADTASRSGPPIFGDEQAGDRQRVVADELRIEPEAALPGQLAVVRIARPAAPSCAVEVCR